MGLERPTGSLESMTIDNIDLASLAIIGAVGDFQDNSESRLIGFNRRILSDAISSGNMKAEIDIRLFGRMTRPVHSLLHYSSDPGLLPYIRNARPSGQNINGGNDDNEKMACVDFLKDLGIDLLDGDGYKCWSQLSHDEKKKVLSALSNRILDAGKGIKTIERMIGEVYVLSSDLPGTPSTWSKGCGPRIRDDGDAWRPSVRALNDAKEFATLLNACGRHGHADIGMAVCMGDRGDALDKALSQQDDHREKLRRAIQLVKEDQQFQDSRGRSVSFPAVFQRGRSDRGYYCRNRGRNASRFARGPVRSSIDSFRRFAGRDRYDQGLG